MAPARIHPAVRLVLLACVIAACSTARRWRAAADARVRRPAVRQVAFGPAPQRVYTVPSVRIPPADPTACEDDGDCPRGACFTGTLEARYSHALRDCDDALAWRAVHRLGTCLPPACNDDRDCPRGERCADTQMLPFPQRTCIPAPCRWDGECRRAAFGRCLHYQAGTPCEHGGWACSYPSDPCVPNDPDRRCAAPRGMIAYCVPRSGRYRCVTEPAPTP